MIAADSIGRRALAALLAMVALALVAATPWDAAKEGLQPVPALSGRVTDLTQTLAPAERQALEAKLADWEARTTNQLAVLIVPTTQPETIEDYSIRVAETWKLGQKGKDNGAIFLIAKNDKRMRIEVGYGFEGVLTDVTSRRIIGDVVAPYFKQGQFAAGINAGVDKVIAVVGGGEPLPAAQPARRSSRGGFDLGTVLIFLLVLVPIAGAFLRSIFGTLPGSLVGAGAIGGVAWLVAGSLLIALIAAVIAFFVIIFSMFGGRGGPGGWIPGGGGGWSSGGGGFSGGGGGFGGGGASGGWG